MESGAKSVELLTAGDDADAETIGAVINQQNIDRQQKDRSITAEAIAIIKREPHWQERRSIVLYNPTWYKGVVGIVASRLVEEFYRPAIVLTESNGMANGSARSIEGFDLYEAIKSCAPLLSAFGGHTHAAGLTMPIENVATFTAQFEAMAQQILTPTMLTPIIKIDAEINFCDITPKFFRVLKQFQPFGPGNMSPVFVTRCAFTYNRPRRVGAAGEHLKFDVIQKEYASAPLPAVAFAMGDFFPHLAAGKPFDLCYTITENTYNGKTCMQLNIKGLRKCEDTV
jgi:single-stranded-DNA-specific exonuclease